MENQLQVIVKESGLDSTKAKYILDNFQNYFEIAAEWETKAKSIVVTREDQKAEMQMARTGRLFLKEKRVAIEKARKELKDQALREGKAIDGIANVLKALIVPVEEYLERQERFVEIREEKRQEERRLEIERRMAAEEEERIAKEKAEQERLRQENIRLAKEAQEREKKMVEERKKQEAILTKERAKADAERKALEEKSRLEREAQEKKLKAERERADTELRQAQEKARKQREKEQAKLEAERKEKERLAELLKNQVECPNCHHKFQLRKG